MTIQTPVRDRPADFAEITTAPSWLKSTRAGSWFWSSEIGSLTPLPTGAPDLASVNETGGTPLQESGGRQSPTVRSERYVGTSSVAELDNARTRASEVATPLAEESEAAKNNAARLELLARQFGSRAANAELEARLQILNARLDHLIPQITPEALEKMADDLESAAARASRSDAAIRRLGLSGTQRR